MAKSPSRVVSSAKLFATCLLIFTLVLANNVGKTNAARGVLSQVLSGNNDDCSPRGREKCKEYCEWMGCTSFVCEEPYGCQCLLPREGKGKTDAARGGVTQVDNSSNECTPRIEEACNDFCENMGHYAGVCTGRGCKCIPWEMQDGTTRNVVI